MSRSVMRFVLAGIALALAGMDSRAAEREKAVVITGVTLIDTRVGSSSAGRTVVIDNGRITSVGDRDRAKSPEGARVIDAAGKFLMPGLFDMHVHPVDRHSLPPYLVNGVTTVRVMNGFFSAGDSIFPDFRTRFAAGDTPRLIVGSPQVDGPGSSADQIHVSRPDEARAAVRKCAAEGYSFIKVYNNISRESYFALATEARIQGISFVGHVPFALTIREAARAGQKSIEHVGDEIWVSCSSREAQLREELPALRQAVSDTRRLVGFYRRVLDSYEPRKARKLAELLVSHNTWLCPTLLIRRNDLPSRRAERKDDERLKFVHPVFRSVWRRDAAPLPEPVRAELFRVSLDIVGTFHRAGVPVLAGSDAVYYPYCFPGFGLHEELQLLVQAGLTPGEAIRSATVLPAKLLGVSEELGVIQPGKLADLVLLDANPLEDIRNTRRIVAVIAAGVVLDENELRRRLEQVGQARR